MKKPNKKKMYNKRRKKTKQERRKCTPDNNQDPSNNNVTDVKSSSKHIRHKFTHRQVPERISAVGQKNLPHYYNNAYTDNLKNWWYNYQSTIRYHVERQRECIETVDKDDNNNSDIEEQLLEKYAALYETSSSEGEEEQEEESYDDIAFCEDDMIYEQSGRLPTTSQQVIDDIDGEYLKFIEITQKHREALRLQRENEGN